jgi:hypothetical protein
MKGYPAEGKRKRRRETEAPTSGAHRTDAFGSYDRFSFWDAVCVSLKRRRKWQIGVHGGGPADSLGACFKVVDSGFFLEGRV